MSRLPVSSDTRCWETSVPLLTSLLCSSRRRANHRPLVLARVQMAGIDVFDQKALEMTKMGTMQDPVLVNSVVSTPHIQLAQERATWPGERSDGREGGGRQVASSQVFLTREMGEANAEPSRRTEEGRTSSGVGAVAASGSEPARELELTEWSQEGKKRKERTELDASHEPNNLRSCNVKGGS